MKNNKKRLRIFALFCAAVVLKAALSPPLRASPVDLSVLRQLSEILALAPGEAQKQKLLTAFVIDNFGEETRDAIVELIKGASQDDDARSLAEHIERVHEASLIAEKAVAEINTDLPSTPNYSHLAEFCDQVRASQDKIDRVGAAIKDLNELHALSQGYLRALVTLEQMAGAMRVFWHKMYGLGLQYDVLKEKTTYGPMAEQWLYWTEGGGSCSEGDPCAGFLLSEARDRWKRVEFNSEKKRTALRNSSDTLKAYDSHFYASSAQRCASGSMQATTESDRTRLNEALGLIDKAKADFKERTQSATAGNTQGSEADQLAEAVRKSKTTTIDGPSTVDTLNVVVESAARDAARHSASQSSGQPAAALPASPPPSTPSKPVSTVKPRCNELDPCGR